MSNVALPASLADVNLDDIFGEAGQNDPNAHAASQPNVEPPAPATTSPEPFLKAATGTVYKTADDAVRGIEQKDALISKLRQESIARTGVDPVTGQRVPEPNQPVSYLSDGKKYVEDLANAATKNDPNEYVRIQSQLAQEQMAPYLPLLTEFAKSKAINDLAHTNPAAREFIGSADYNKTLESYPALGEAIQFAEQNPAAGQRLGEFYSMAVALNSSLKLPEQVRSTPLVAQTIRPTVTSSASHPPPTVTYTGQPDMTTSEGRKAIIAEQERAGAANLRF
jgi:hypothetical protein